MTADGKAHGGRLAGVMYGAALAVSLAFDHTDAVFGTRALFVVGWWLLFYPKGTTARHRFRSLTGILGIVAAVVALVGEGYLTMRPHH